jgi:hypothetical protein
MEAKMPSIFKTRFHTTFLVLPIGGFILMTHLFGLLNVTSLSASTEEVYLLDRALETIAMHRGDVSIRPDLFPIPFASSRFRRWIENPLKATAEAQQEAMGLFQMAEDPFLWVQALAELGDLHSVDPALVRKYNRYERPPGPLAVRKAIYLLLDAIHTANVKMAILKDAMSPEDMTLLEQYLYPICFAERDFKEPIGGRLIQTEQLRRAIDIAGGIDRRGVVEAGLSIVKALAEAQQVLAKTDDLKNHIGSFSLMTDLGLIEIGGTGPDVHENHAALIIDLGGNDLYKGEIASGTNGKCSIVLDLDGNDVYLGQDCTQACGIWGIGILFDFKGNDIYRAGCCSQGAGVFGMGLLIDGGGTDSYLGEQFVQAASSMGWGALLDLDGEDMYQCHHSGQAYSGTLGISCLCDIKGNDKYISGAKAPDPREKDMNQSYSQGFALGIRNLTAGGFALLADRSGNDLYQCQYFGQGASYWMGVGILYDESGKDIYVARRYAQGAGIHYSFGVLMDVGGNDHTFSWGASQGCGHDYGMGILVNEAGNDTYASDWLSMGASEANGVGIFVDNAGDDGYESNTGMGVGHLVERRQAGGIGLFIDAGGKDRYSKNGADNSTWGTNRWGIGMDENQGGVSGFNLTCPVSGSTVSEEGERKKTREKTHLSGKLAGSETMPYPKNIEQMLSVASHWGLERGIPEEAREKLLCLPPEKSVPVMVNMLDTPNIMSLTFMERFFTVHAFHAVPELIKKTRSPDALSKKRAFYYLGLLRDSRALEYCVEAVKDPSWQIRSGAIKALGEILNQKRLQVLIPMKDAFDEALKKDDPNIIESYLKDDDKILNVLDVLTHTVSVQYQTYVRYEKLASGVEVREDNLEEFVSLAFHHLDTMLTNVERWISDIDRSGDIAERLMVPLMDRDPAVRKAAAYALGQMNYQPVITELLVLLKDPHLWVRDAAALSLALFGGEVIQPLVFAMEQESASFRILAMDVLARIKSNRAKSLIEKYLEDPSQSVRRAAKQALYTF